MSGDPKCSAPEMQDIGEDAPSVIILGGLGGLIHWIFLANPLDFSNFSWIGWI